MTTDLTRDLRAELDKYYDLEPGSLLDGLVGVVEAAGELAVEAAVDDDMDDTAFYEAVGEVCSAVARLRAAVPERVGGGG